MSKLGRQGMYTQHDGNPLGGCKLGSKRWEKSIKMNRTEMKLEEGRLVELILDRRK